MTPRSMKLAALTIAAFALGCEADLNEKHVWIGAAHGFEGGAGALVDGPILDAATAFARRNGLAITSSAAPCADAGCDLERLPPQPRSARPLRRSARA